MSIAGGKVTVTALTHRGAVRPANEDSMVLGSLVANSTTMASPIRCVLSMDEPLIFAVADGLGGQAAGEIASQHVARRLAEVGPKLSGDTDLLTALSYINKELIDHEQQNKEFDGMGSTVTGLLLHNEEKIWFNVGDSRLYRLNGTSLIQISQDDSPGKTTENGKTANTNFITQCMGGTSTGSLEPHIGREVGDAWLMCSDGLSDLVPVEEMERIVARSGSDEVVVHSLWSSAMEAGGKDNITIILARRF